MNNAININNKKSKLASLKDNTLSHSMVHYLLTIHRLKEDKGYARVTDIARVLGLTKGSVSTALSNLKKKKLVIEEDDSKFLYLSEEGHQEVHEILASRTLLFYFLRDILGVAEEIAHRDSCYTEHLFHTETREKIFAFMKEYASTSSGTTPYKAIFKTTLDLSEYKSAKELEGGQKGDSYI